MITQLRNALLLSRSIGLLSLSTSRLLTQAAAQIRLRQQSISTPRPQTPAPTSPPPCHGAPRAQAHHPRLRRRLVRRLPGPRHTTIQQSPNAELLAKHFIVVHVDTGHVDHNVDVAEKYHVPIDQGHSFSRRPRRPRQPPLRRAERSSRTCAACSRGHHRLPQPSGRLSLVADPFLGPDAHEKTPSPSRRSSIGALLRAIRHDCLNLAQSTAYSAMVALFPALIVAAAIISLSARYHSPPLSALHLLRSILPPDVSPLLQSYFDPSPQTTRFHPRPHPRLPRQPHRGLQRYRHLSWKASAAPMTFLPTAGPSGSAAAAPSLLVPLSLIPFASPAPRCLRALHHSVARPARHALRSHPGLSHRASHSLDRRSHRQRRSHRSHLSHGNAHASVLEADLPGAIVVDRHVVSRHVIFGWYVTRFANYSQVYGSLGAAIALLFWLYIISLCVLYGAEFNVEFHPHFFARIAPITQTRPSSPQNPPARLELPTAVKTYWSYHRILRRW